MAYWGMAISQRPNPLVPPWTTENLKRGLDASVKGKALATTERERDWLMALEQAYAGYDSVPTTTRSERYEQAMERLARKYPDDKVAAIFYALASRTSYHRDRPLPARRARRRSPPPCRRDTCGPASPSPVHSALCASSLERCRNPRMPVPAP